MARPAIKQSSGLFSTWVDFRSELYAENINEVREWVNVSTGNKYTYSRFHEYMHRERSVPDSICNLINGDMEDLLTWLLSQNLSTKTLAQRLSLPIKAD